MNKKSEQLGMNISTANSALRKELLFKYVKLAGHNVCYQCEEAIEDIKQFSIEHKTPWLDSEEPKCLYFDLENIAFSHLSCNCKAARKTNQYKFTDEDRRKAKSIANKKYDSSPEAKQKRKERRLAQKC